MNRVLVTGSSGFIGSELSKYLDLQGYKVWKLDKNSKLESEHEFQIDISKKTQFESISNLQFDTIVHCAAQTDVRQSVDQPAPDLLSNTLGTLFLIEFAVDVGVKNFVYINSGGAIYGEDQLPLNEKSTISPASPYGLSKFAGEEYVRILSNRFGLNWSSLALSNVYGEVKRNQKGVIYEFAKSLLENRTPVIYGKEVTRDFIYIDDVLRAIEKAIITPTNCRVNISSNVETSIHEIYNIVAQKLRHEVKPEIKEPRFGEIMRSRLDNSLAKNLLGWSPLVSITEGVNLSLEVIAEMPEQ